HPSPGSAADAKAWERLWARSRLVLHATGQGLTCSLSAPCDPLAELVPCWQPAPTAPCQALPGLQQPAVGQGPQEFGGLRPHPNLCVQVRSSGQVRLTQCLRDREYCPPGLPSPCPPSAGTSPGALPGRTSDILLLEHGVNASLCALERGTCTPLASFASSVRVRDPRVLAVAALAVQPAHPVPPAQTAGHPGLLERELRRDVAARQCRQVGACSRRAAGMDPAVCDMSPFPQIWQRGNDTGVTFWACPLHKYLRARWVLAWMGVLLGTACLLLLLLMKKEDVKG
ncbi:I17RC protein, partial [Ardeotis kori]|nr:I17RC protein [Ardeotis kori]